MILSPQAHDAACDLLNVPRDTRLTAAQILEASSIEFINSRRDMCAHCEPGNPCQVHQ